jgi:glycosyltransferase involved in cell wall biosynthesis
VVHKANGGLSSARNAGLDVATGEYVMFVDSDDVILPEMLTDLVAEAVEHDYDIVGSNLASLDGKRRIIHYASRCCEFSGNEMLCAFLLMNIDLSACTKIYRRNIIGDTRFILNRRSEDFPFLVEIYSKQPRAVYLPVGYYQYRSTPGSISNVFNKSYFDQFINVEDASSLTKSADKKVVKSYNIYRIRLNVDVAKDLLVNKVTKQYNQEFKRCINTINSQALHLLTFQSGWKYFVKYIAVLIMSLFR